MLYKIPTIMKTKFISCLLPALCLHFSSFVGHAQTGIANPFMTACDASVQSFLNTYNIPGATFALSKEGKIIYLRAFGHANTEGTEATQPYHRFRIASLSKPVTGIAVMKLVEQGAIQLGDKVFGTGGLLENDPDFAALTITDSRIYDITVQQLLEHTAGWNRDQNCFPNPTAPYTVQHGGCDPIVAPLHVSAVMGTSNPVSEASLVGFLLEKGLDTAPGTTYNYSNMGYLILGKIIESRTGVRYEDYVRDSIMALVGACDMSIATNYKMQKQEREGEYIGNGGGTLNSNGDGTIVPWEYGGLHVAAMGAHGGWIATASDLVRLITAVDNFNTKPDILSSSTINTMVTPSAANANYAKGWTVNNFNNWWHTGAIDGTASILARTSNGYTWAVILNKRVVDGSSNAFWTALDALPWNCISSATGTPDYDLMLQPATNASALEATVTSSSAVTLHWTNGNGNRRLVVAAKNKAVDAFPLDGTDYTADATFGSGDDLGNGNFVLYDGDANTADITGLDSAASYQFRLFEYNRNTQTGGYALYKLCNCAMREVSMGSSGITSVTPESEQYVIHPNPASAVLTIEQPEGGQAAYAITYNLEGKELMQQSLSAGQQEWHIDVRHLPQGLYILTLKNKDGLVLHRHKWMKQ